MRSLALVWSASDSFSSISTAWPIVGPNRSAAGWTCSSLQMARNVCRYRLRVGLWFKIFDSTGWYRASGGSSLPSVLSHSLLKLKSLALIAAFRRLIISTVSRSAMSFFGSCEYFSFILRFQFFCEVGPMVSNGYLRAQTVVGVGDFRFFCRSKFHRQGIPDGLCPRRWEWSVRRRT